MAVLRMVPTMFWQTQWSSSSVVIVVSNDGAILISDLRKWWILPLGGWYCGQALALFGHRVMKNNCQGKLRI